MRATSRTLALSCMMARAVIAVTGALSSQATVEAQGDASTQRPNIVFIFADDLGWGDLGCHGHPHILTPNLDRLAADGTDFHQFVVCNPVCSPSRTACMTGQYPARLGVHAHFAGPSQNRERGMPDWLDPSVPNVASRLKEAGYRTGHFGKWHLSGGAVEGAPDPHEYGFDKSNVYVGPGPSVFGEGSSFARFVGQTAHGKESASYLSAAATEHAIRFLRAGAGPFYVNLWLHETHHLVSATDEDKRGYPDTPEPQRTYYAAVSRADRLVGELLRVIDELGQTDNTLVVFSSDNGPEHSQPRPTDKLYYSVGTTGGRRGQKRSLYMGGVNVPFLVKWPGEVPCGRVDRSSVIAGVDLYPTFTAAAGVNIGEADTIDGEDVTAAFRGESFERSKPLFWEWRGPYRRDPDWPAYGVREGMWAMVADAAAIGGDSSARLELYDLERDPYQQTNLADDEPARVQRFRDHLDAWRHTLPAGPFMLPPGPSEVLTDAQLKRLEMFRKKDRDNDGSISTAEWLEGMRDPAVAKERLARWDDNGDGVLSQREYVTPNAD